MDQGLARGARDRGNWIVLDCSRALYVGRGRDTILCDRLPSPVTLVVKLQGEAVMTTREDEMVLRHKAITALSSERDLLVEALIAELHLYSVDNAKSEYGRGWNCAMEEAEAIVRRITGVTGG
jgi:hypothetical protein